MQRSALLLLLATFAIRFSGSIASNSGGAGDGGPRSWGSWKDMHKLEVGSYAPQETHARGSIENELLGSYSTIKAYWRSSDYGIGSNVGYRVFGPFWDQFVYAGLGMVVGGLGVAWLVHSGFVGRSREEKSRLEKIAHRKTSFSRSLSLDDMVSEAEGSTCDGEMPKKKEKKHERRGHNWREKEKENEHRNLVNPNNGVLRTSCSVPDLSIPSLSGSPRETTQPKHPWNKCIEFSGNLGHNGVWPMASAETESSCHAINPHYPPVEPATPSTPLKPEIPDAFADWSPVRGEPKFFHRPHSNLVVLSPVGSQSPETSAVVFSHTDPELKSVFEEIRTSLHKQEKRKMIKERWAHSMDSLQWGAAALNMVILGCVIAFGRWQYLVGGCPNPAGRFDVNGYIDLLGCLAKETVLLVVGVPFTLMLIRGIITSNFFGRKNPLATPLLLIVFMFLGFCEAVAIGIAGGSTNCFMGCWLCYSLVSVWHTKVKMRSPIRRAKVEDLPDDEADSGLCIEDDSTISSIFLALIFPVLMGVLPFWDVGLSDCLAGMMDRWWQFLLR